MMKQRKFIRSIGLVLCVVTALATEGVVANAANPAQVKQAISQRDWKSLKTFGQAAHSVMLDWYPQADPDTRAKIAEGFYRLGIKSEAARELLERDIHTEHTSLRLQVQWALGRVSDEPIVVNLLLDNMQNDKNPLFRDKAACALAYDQIHLNEQQKVRLYEGLIGSLENPKLQVRTIAIKALKIHTGQTKGFRSTASLEQRERAIDEWKRWLEEYKSNI